MEQAKTLAQWRKAAPMSQSELAEASGVSSELIRRIEDGRRGKATRPATMRALADALGIRPDQVTEFRRTMGLDEESE